MAASLIETLSGEFDASQYKDEYREALQQVIEAKVEGREVVQTAEAQPTSGTVVDLMAALRASVEAAKSGRPAAVPDRDASDEPAGDQAAAKGGSTPVKAAGKKAPAKKATAKKAPATKTPARKAAAGSTGKASAPGEESGKKAPAKRAARKSA